MSGLYLINSSWLLLLILIWGLSTSCEHYLDCNYKQCFTNKKYRAQLKWSMNLNYFLLWLQTWIYMYSIRGSDMDLISKYRLDTGLRLNKMLLKPNTVGHSSPHQCLHGQAAPESRHCPPAVHSNTPGSRLLPGWSHPAGSSGPSLLPGLVFPTEERTKRSELLQQCCTSLYIHFLAWLCCMHLSH